MTTAATISARLTLDSSDYDKGMAQADKTLSGFSDRMKQIGGSLAKAGGLMTAGITAPLVAFGKQSVDLFKIQEAAVADVEATIASTGGVAGLTSEELQKMASALQNVTTFGDEATLKGQAMLLTFTNIGKDIFPQATETMLNMAQKFGSMDSAAVQLGKALQDPIMGVSALRRVGVNLTEQQEEQIRQMVEMGDLAGAQAVILKELEVEFGGLARAMAETRGGQMQQFQNKWGDIQEQIGAVIIPVLLDLVNAITPLIDKFANASPQMQKWIVLGAGIVAALGPIIVIIGGIISAIGAIAPVVATIAGVLSGVAVPILAIIAVIALLVAAWKTNFLGIRDFVTAWWESIKLIFQAFQAALRGDWTQFGELMRAAWDNWMSFVSNAVRGWGDKIIQGFINLVNKIKQAFTIDWSQLGKNIINGLVNGLRNGVNAVVGAAKNIASAASDAFKGFFGIHSPSELMMRYGRDIVQGEIMGMEEKKGDLLRASHGISQAAASAMTPMLNIAGAPGGKMSQEGFNSTIKSFTPESYQTWLKGFIASRSPTPAGAGASGGNQVQVTVNNPKKETAEESIRKTLKGLSYTGVMPV